MFAWIIVVEIVLIVLLLGYNFVATKPLFIVNGRNDPNRSLLSCIKSGGRWKRGSVYPVGAKVIETRGFCRYLSLDGREYCYENADCEDVCITDYGDTIKGYGNQDSDEYYLLGVCGSDPGSTFPFTGWGVLEEKKKTFKLGPPIH